MTRATWPALDRQLARPGPRAAAIGALLAALAVLASSGAIPLLAWTPPLLASATYPALFALIFVAYLVVEHAPLTWRKPALLVASVGAMAIFDPRFAALSLGCFALVHALVFARCHRAWKLGFLAGSLAIWLVPYSAALGPTFLLDHPWLPAFGTMFALNYSFRLFYLHHAARLTAYRRAPLVDVVLYLGFAPFFVIVPYMFAIPRFDRFRAALVRRDPAASRAAIRHLARGLGWSLVCAAGAASFDLGGALRDAAEQRRWLEVVVLGLAHYPVWAVVAALGPAYVLVGLCGLCGVDLAPAFDAPLRADSVLDWWRRWNLAFRDFLVDLFFHPVALGKLRRRPTLALLAGTAAVFLLGSTLFHLPKYALVRVGALGPNAGLVVENAVFALLVAGGLVLERRRGRAERPRPTLARIAATWLIVSLVVQAGYLIGWRVDEAEAERLHGRLEPARGAHAAGDRPGARAAVHGLSAALAREVAARPRDPTRRLDLALALALDGQPGPAARELALADLFIESGDLGRHLQRAAVRFALPAPLPGGDHARAFERDPR